MRKAEEVEKIFSVVLEVNYKILNLWQSNLHVKSWNLLINPNKNINNTQPVNSDHCDWTVHEQIHQTDNSQLFCQDSAASENNDKFFAIRRLLEINWLIAILFQHIQQNLRKKTINISHPSNYEKRIFIRPTWGNSSQMIVKIIFILCLVEKLLLQVFIEVEYSQLGDIIEENFIDSYFNLTNTEAAHKIYNEAQHESRTTICTSQDYYEETWIIS